MLASDYIPSYFRSLWQDSRTQRKLLDLGNIATATLPNEHIAAMIDQCIAFVGRAFDQDNEPLDLHRAGETWRPNPDLTASEDLQLLAHRVIQFQAIIQYGCEPIPYFDIKWAGRQPYAAVADWLERGQLLLMKLSGNGHERFKVTVAPADVHRWQHFGELLRNEVLCEGDEFDGWPYITESPPQIHWRGRSGDLSPSTLPLAQLFFDKDHSGGFSYVDIGKACYGDELKKSSTIRSLIRRLLEELEYAGFSELKASIVLMGNGYRGVDRKRFDPPRNPSTPDSLR
jgi:hypothetical protein